jgi:adenylylsulfate kinase
MVETGVTSQNVTWSEGRVTRADREDANGHRGATIWFTGLSGSGKSTLARALEDALFRRGCSVFVLDGDNVRQGLNRDLGFSPEDRAENIRRVGEVARLLTEFGSFAVTAFISPYREDRAGVRACAQAGDFIEVYLDCSLEVCERRDPKGLYRKARKGEIAEFTGISAPYELPDAPELVLATAELTVDQCVQRVLTYLQERGYLTAGGRLAAKPA